MQIRGTTNFIGKYWTAIILGIIAILILAHAWVEYEGPNQPSSLSDAEIYFRMALDPFTFTSAPASYRLLLPLIIYYLPLPTGLGYLLLTSILLYTTIILFYFYLSALGLPWINVLEGLLILISSFFLWYNMFNYSLIDSLVYLSVIGCYLAIQKQNHLLFWLFLILGASSKEISLFILPVYFLHLFKAKSFLAQEKYKDFAIYTVLASFAALIVSLLIIMIIRVGIDYIFGPDFAYQSHLTIRKILHIIRWRILSVVFLKKVFFVFTIYWGFMIVNLILYKDNRLFLLWNSSYLVLTMGLIFVATDTARMLIYLFPILIPIAVNGLTPLQALQYLPLPIRILSYIGLSLLPMPLVQSSLFFNKEKYLPFTILLCVFGIIFLIFTLSKYREKFHLASQSSSQSLKRSLSTRYSLFSQG